MRMVGARQVGKTSREDDDLVLDWSETGEELWRGAFHKKFSATVFSQGGKVRSR